MVHHATVPLWSSASIDAKLDILKRLVDDLYEHTYRSAIDDILASLENYVPIDQEEAENVREVKHNASKYPNILCSNCEIGHITASALVVDIVSNRLLLNYHAVIQKWLPFGGHADLEITPSEIALREAKEESGLKDLDFYPGGLPRLIDVDAHIIRSTKNHPEHHHFDFRYLLSTNCPELARPSTESRELRWFSYTEALDMGLEPNIRRFIAKCTSIIQHAKTEA